MRIDLDTEASYSFELGGRKTVIFLENGNYGIEYWTLQDNKYWKYHSSWQCSVYDKQKLEKFKREWLFSV